MRSGKHFFLVGGGLAGIFLLMGTLAGAADFSRAADKIRDAVVTATVEKNIGSGFIVNGEGDILTSQHLVGTAQQARVKLANGEELPAKVTRTDTARDLALLKVERTHLPAVIFASSDKLKQGEEVAAIGAPLGLSESLTKGAISATSREIEGRTYLQIDAALNEGNSGGPIINQNGYVVGVATKAAEKAQNVGFAIPSVEVMAFLNEAGVAFAALDAPPVAAPAPAEEKPQAAAQEAPSPPEATPAPGSPVPSPQGLRLKPWVWLAAAAVVAFFVSLLTALIVAKLALRRPLAAPPLGYPGASAAPYAAQTPSPGWGTAAPAQQQGMRPQPSPPGEEDLSDIDIELQ